MSGKRESQLKPKFPPSPAFYSHVETCQQETFSQVNTGFLEDLALMILMKGVGGGGNCSVFAQGSHRVQCLALFHGF